MNYKLKTFTKNITVPVGTGAGSIERKAEFGIEYKRMLGYYAVVLQNGGLTPEQCSLSISNSSETLVDKVTLAHYQVDKALAIKDRFYKEEPFQINGGYCNLVLATPAVTTSTLDVQIVMLVTQEP